MKKSKELHLGFLVLSLFVAVAMFSSCGKEKQDIGNIAVEYVESLYKGNYQLAADNTTGSAEASVQYREHLQLLYRNMVEDNTQEHGALVSAKCSNVSVDEAHHSADVFLHLTFADSTHQDILLPMEQHGDRWLMK